MTDEALTTEQLPLDDADLATEIAELLAEVPKYATWEDRSAYVARCLLRKFTITPILALIASAQGKDGGERVCERTPGTVCLLNPDASDSGYGFDGKCGHPNCPLMKKDG